MEVDHFVKPWRLIRFLFVWLAIGHFTLSGIVIATGAGAWSWAPPGTTDFLDWCRALPRPSDTKLFALIWPTAFAFSVQGSWRGLPMVVPPLPILALVMLPWILMPLWTVPLDATFRLAKVRQVHLLRGLAYSLPGTLAWFYFLLAFFIVRAPVGGPAWDRPRAVAAALYAVYLAYHITWWHQFIARYLRLQQAKLIVAVHFFMTALALTAAGAIFFSWRIL
jgi:hypothetical protein